ncbi:hypothetical protein TD95_002018 [Thielaviopsis punctulata]|uniref:Fucose-specific lectin n=1 Tax=Thielaviopsis punctulata TaxID=72032 RepID=A0A0F4ZAA2_9PEZI|nr:hypothetical protein TD95_002018 [Thielaviopsis punctulata]
MHVFPLASLLFLASSAAAKSYQIRGVTAPVFHLYLQSTPMTSDNDTLLAVLGPEASGDEFDVGNTIQSTNNSLYLNIEDSSKTYKRVLFGEKATTTGWGLDGDTIITTTNSSYGRQQNFLACELSNGMYQLYLQTGNDMPCNKKCSKWQTIHLPCLC